MQLDQKRLLIFGGINRRVRYNDVWVLNVADKKWEQPKIEGPCPAARAHHTATKCGSKILVFGGYAGNGRALGDLWILHLSEDSVPLRWEEALLSGTSPTPRFDHCAFIFPVTPNSSTFDKYMVMGGRDNASQFSDSYMLDLNKMAWELDAKPPALTYELCNNLCDDIESVPYHKVFTFGGKRGATDFQNVVEVMDCGMQFWHQPEVQGTPPCPREDTAWVFDIKTCCLYLFGGWSNRWLGDTWKVNVSPIIGPPYACTAVEPDIGPVFGNSEIIIKGLRFTDGKCQVKFGTGKSEIIQDAEYVDPSTLKVKTPNYEVYGAMTVDIRVNISGEGWTVNKIQFNYFANTSAKNCLAYGPGLLPQGQVFGVEMPFIIQAKDTCNNKRSSGSDLFTVRVVAAEGEMQGGSRIVDLHNGLYEVFYTAPATGAFLVHVEYADAGLNPVPVGIRGSPFAVECTDPWTKYRVLGALPARRQGLSMFTMADDLVVYGGDKSGLAVCTMAGADWKWAAPAIAGKEPVSRKFQSLTAMGSQMVMFGGQSLEDNADLNDLFFLTKIADGYSWTSPEGVTGFVRAALPDSPAALPTERNSHAAVAIDSDLLILGGESNAELVQEMCMIDTEKQGNLAWVNPILNGTTPAARKGASAACTQNRFVVVFGGKGVDADAKEVIKDDLLLLEMDDGPSTIKVSALDIKGLKPAPRMNAMFQECGQGKLMLFGGLGADGKPLNDAWVLDLEQRAWNLIYLGHADLCPPQGAVATLHGSKLVCLNSAAGSPKLDLAMSLDIQATAEQYGFAAKMRNQAIEQLKALETWVERQATGLDMAANPESLRQSFDKLLKVMDSLYQARVKKSETDLLIDQLKETLHYLTVQNKINMHKADKELSEVAARWEEIKKGTSQVKNEVQPIQEAEAARIKSEVAVFARRVADCQKGFRTRSFYKYSTGAEKAYPEIDQAAKDYEDMAAELHKHTQLSNMFDCPETVATAAEGVAAIKADLVMVKDVWDASSLVEQQFQVWRQTLWTDIRTDVMEEGTKAFVKEVKALPKAVRDEDCFKGLDLSVKNFLTSVPLVADLRSPAMRERHWTQLMTTTKVQFVLDDNFKLDDLLKLELHKFADEVGEIVDCAQKEEKMEQGLAKLKDTWSHVEFKFAQHKGTDVYLVKMAEEDFEALEDNQVLVQGMMANRYMNTFRDEILGWNKKLMNVADVNQIITEIQRTWAYLESLFIHSEEVKKELPEAAVRFANIDKEVKIILKEFGEVKNCVAACNKQGLMKHLEKQQKELEICEKALAEYMESKRRAFPRFYFVSSADLLDILSNGNNPIKVMQHMNKCFQAVEKLKLDTETPAAGVRPKGLGMVSCVGTEYVSFKSPLPLDNKVEEYMTDIIFKMRGDLRDILHESVVDYPSKAREKWIFDWPSQIILVVNQIFWCQEVEEAFMKLNKGQANAMKEYNQFQVKQLTKLIEVTRTDLKKEDRQKVMNMITIDAHSRDMVESIAQSGIDRADCFQWMCQLRSYWDSTVNDCRIRICDATFPYGYEYLGNGARLVVTPLTDRIYITATQACWLSMGTAPAGPAGTGKTETTKDLSAQLGKSIYVFNCAPEMDYRTMGDIFKGLAASGSWGCFDEFNRLVPEVLSVCSVQYKCVTDAQKRKTILPGRGLEYIDRSGTKHKAIESYTFVAADGVLMPLEEGTSAFITMNPGYIGRAELPESLKALFRPITVVVPDRQLIMENMLMAEGFVEAKMLAKKFASLYYLLEDLLSPAKHYDWGLRAIKSVLVVAGSLLRAQEGQVESDVLFRALRDFNIPKILSQDMVIFTGLLQDLFPAVDPPRKRDIEFEKVIVDTTLKMGLTPEDDFILRVVQLSELLAIRHCVFLMGPTGSGRSECFKVLAKAIQTGTDKPVNTYLEACNRKKVTIRDLDPKSISTQELYGYVNMATREWKDGLLSYNMRELANQPDDNPKWILLDGDLDANWIESMNSVMDDNRLLTLPSNERIRLLPHMKMIFEIRDLKYATPATATRAGILYISEGEQWNNMVQSWIQKIVRPYAEKSKWKDVEQPIGWMRDLFMKYVPATIFEMKKSFSPVTPLNAMNYVTTLVNILEGCLKPENLNNKADQPMFEMMFAFAMIWAFGGALCEKDGISYRKNFDKWWKGTWTTVKIPGKGTIYDYFVNFKTSKFTPWTDLVTDIDYDSGMPMSSLFVPTAETSSLRFFLDLMVGLKKPIMFVGGAGVGKTQLVKGKLAQLPEDMASLAISFNYFTDVISFQKILESPLEKKAGINYGPPGTKQLVYFVDDLNMPKLDPYETAMPISLIRQHLGWGHWFDRAKLTQKNINNTQYVACMNPTAGSFVVNPRLQRLFMTLAVEFPGQESLMKIYGTFVTGHLKKFSADVQEMGTKILQAALALHEKVAGTFRKTAVNFHYEFTVRHLANVFQGLLMSTPEQFNNVTKLSRLWLHESERVYADRLVSAADLTNYNKNAVIIAKKYFNVSDIDDYYKKADAKPLIFCHFARGLGDKVYNEVTEFKDLYKTLMEALNEYNETNAVMDLVLFEDAMKHVCRISRIISSPSGHALLVGVGGSGKQSLARLSGFICGYATYTIVISGNYNMNNFREDLQKMYKRAGVKGEGIMFLFTDSQIVDEKMLVYVNDLLSSGEIPDLFAQEDKDEIINAVRSETKALGLVDTSENCWSTFIQKVRNNLHMVFTASPVGANFRVRSQRFLATINSTVIDWFQPWPEASLHSVAKKFLDDVELGNESIRAAVVEFMPYSFAAVNAQSKRFLEVEKRYNYTTPKTFLELIKLYKSVLARKRNQVQEAIDRLDTGLAKLQKTQKDVDVLVEEAKIKAVEVEKKVAGADAFAEQVGVEKTKVNLENEAAQVEAEKCGVIAKDVTELQVRCEKDLAAAEPLVAQAEAALDTLNKKDLGEAKSLKKPPPGVDDITAVVIILLEGNPKDKSWGAACKMMNNVDKFLDRLKTFKPLIDDGKIPKKSFDATRSYLELPHFNRDIISNKSKAAAGLCDWAINIVKYYDVVSEVEPKRLELAGANDKLAAANTTLKQVQDKVALLNAQVQELEDQYNKALAEKNAAIAESERCQRKLGLANRLIAALASEGDRWALTVQQLRKDYQVLTGDMLLAAAFVSYAGPFTSKFRSQLIKEWIKFLTDKGAPMTAGISDPLKVLVDDATVASWVREGLPSDPTSMQNGTILTNSERWPLMMDPQLQGIVWIKERESSHKLQVVRMGVASTVTAMERAMEAGHSVLIENMGENIDAVLNPVITRSTFKKGRSLYVKLGDKDVEYNKNFRLILHTKLSNPHYPPEIQAETTLINFTVTESGLEDQLLALVVNKERPDLEETKTQLIIQNTDFTIKLKQLEDDLLYKLSSAEGDMTEDLALIESLEESKRVADEISEKVAEAKTTEEQINEARNKYRTVAARGAMLFFLLNSLNKIHAFYQYSLNAFVTVFSRAIDVAPGGRRKPVPKVTITELNRRLTGEPKDFQEVMEQARRVSQGGEAPAADAASSSAPGLAAETILEDEADQDDVAPTPEQLEIRLKTLLDTCTYVVFNYTRRGLFDKDKLIVLTLLTFHIMLKEQRIGVEEYEALCKGTRNLTPPSITDELSRWVNETQWSALQPLTQLPAYGTLAKDMEKNSDEWEKWCLLEASEKAPMPGDWGKISDFRQLLIVRALKPGRITNALQNFCEKAMGSRYVNQDAFSPAVVMGEASSSTPIFFILFPGYSPSKEIEAYAREVNHTVENGKLTLISMGQGQEGPAEAILDKYTKEGGWVFLDNVHLMQGWIPNLERKLEIAAETAHPDFRCFFSAEPINGAPQAKIVPESILQTCIKISNEPPSDMRSNMRRAFAAFNQEMCSRPSTVAKQTAFKSILFGLCFYHSLLLGRKKFGTGIGSGAGSGLGFCRGYSFNMGDLTTCGDVLFNYLEANQAVPWDDLRYMFGEVFYGGHITDDMDRRCCITYLQVLIKPEIMPQGDAPPSLELAPGFKAPVPTDYASMKEYIEAALPAESPIMYGMHTNAELSLLTSQGETLFRTVIEVTGGGGAAGASGGSSEAAVRTALEDYMARLPEPLNMVEIEARVKDKTPYVVVALQEAARMNTLLTEMRQSMEELLLGLGGSLNMSDKMEKLATGIATNTVPALWMAQVSTRYQEVFTLTLWYMDILKRYEQLNNWTAGSITTPNSVWLPGLFNPKAFLTAVMQTYARQHKLPLDVMKFRTDVTTKSVEQITEAAPVGCYIHGLCLEGARWDKEDGVLKDSLPNQLHPALPVLQVVPVTIDEYSLQGYYSCPVYTNMQRANVYSPIVSNFTMKTDEPSHKWVLASVAVLLQDELA
ncbi:TPA: Dynein alpha chain, flagellar outer arm [Trebouxia sp. C0004]